MGNKSSRPRSSSASGRGQTQTTTTPQRTTAQQRAARAASMNGGSPHRETTLHRTRSSTTAGLVSQLVASPHATPAPAVAVRETVVVFSEASFMKHPPTHRPTGITYPLKSCRWPPDLLATMVSNRVIAPFATGNDEPADVEGVVLEECPLCMLYYSTGLNFCIVCCQGMCSDCFANLLDAPPKPASKCPFCNASPFRPSFSGPRSQEQIQKIAEEAESVRRAERLQLETAIAEERARIERKKAGEPASPPPPPPALVAVTPPREQIQSADPDMDLFDLPPDMRRIIRTEEFRQHLILFYRYKRPEGLRLVDDVVSKYGADREAEVFAVSQRKWGDMPPASETRLDVQQRLVLHYSRRGGKLTETEAETMVARFGNCPWKAMARAIVERGREGELPPIPSDRRTSPLAATPERPTATSQGGAVLSPQLVLAGLPDEMRRQTMVEYARLRQPAMVPLLMELFETHSGIHYTDAHVSAVAVECGIEDVESLEEPIAADVTRRLRTYFANNLPHRPPSDVDHILERYAGREIAMISAVVLKYGPDPSRGLEPPPTSGESTGVLSTDSEMVLRALLSMDNLDDDLATALRQSVTAL